MSQLEKIKRWEEAEKNATPGPWRLEGSRIVTTTALYEGDEVVDPEFTLEIASLYNEWDDGPFIAAARAVSPSAIRRLVEAALCRQEVLEAFQAAHKRPFNYDACQSWAEEQSCALTLYNEALRPFMEDSDEPRD